MPPWVDIALALVIVGTLNWVLVSVLKFDLGAKVVEEDFSRLHIASRLISVLMGAAGPALAPALARSTSHRGDGYLLDAIAVRHGLVG